MQNGGIMKQELLLRLADVVWVDSGRMSGAPCFKGFGIPVQMPIDHLAAGFSLDEVLETAPTLDRAQAQQFIELAGEQIEPCGNALIRGPEGGEPDPPLHFGNLVASNPGIMRKAFL